MAADSQKISSIKPQPHVLYKLSKIDVELDKLPWTSDTEFLVIVNHNDYDISWADKLKYPHIIYHKNQPDKEPFNALNKGKSETNLLKFIYQFYDHLPQNIIVVYQYETKFYHVGSLVDILNDPDFSTKYYNQPTIGYYNFNVTKLGSIKPQIIKMIHSGWWDETMTPWFGSILDYGDFTYNKSACAQFVVSRDRIHSLPRKFYSNMYNWIINNTLDEIIPDHLNKNRQALETDVVWTSNFHVSRYMECSWELIFSTYKSKENKIYPLEYRDILVLFGAGSFWIDVTPTIIKNLYHSGKIIIPANLVLNQIFDPVYGTVKTLKIKIDDKEHEIPENRTADWVIVL